MGFLQGNRGTLCLVGFERLRKWSLLWCLFRNIWWICGVFWGLFVERLLGLWIVVGVSRILSRLRSRRSLLVFCFLGSRRRGREEWTWILGYFCCFLAFLDRFFKVLGLGILGIAILVECGLLKWRGEGIRWSVCGGVLGGSLWAILLVLAGVLRILDGFRVFGAWNRRGLSQVGVGLLVGVCRRIWGFLGRCSLGIFECFLIGIRRFVFLFCSRFCRRIVLWFVFGKLFYLLIGRGRLGKTFRGYLWWFCRGLCRRLGSPG